LGKEKMHAATAIDIYERLEKAIATLDRENTPEEFKEAIEELKRLAENVKVSYAKKPISRKAWKNVWADTIGDFIGAFEHNVVNDELVDEDRHEAFLKGMAKGMWSIYNMIEELMVDKE